MVRGCPRESRSHPRNRSSRVRRERRHLDEPDRATRRRRTRPTSSSSPAPSGAHPTGKTTARGACSHSSLTDYAPTNDTAFEPDNLAGVRFTPLLDHILGRAGGPISRLSIRHPTPRLTSGLVRNTGGMPQATLDEELSRARQELSTPPGESEVTRRYAGMAASLLACLRYSGLSDNDIRAEIQAYDPGFLDRRLQQLESSDAPDSDDAALLLGGLSRTPAFELRDAMAMVATALSGTF
jgi:hypothetical protein